MRNGKNIIEFGDFQTPDQLAKQICQLLVKSGIKPKSILEPTCGKGSFIHSALQEISSATNAVGVDINKEYLDISKSRLRNHNGKNIKLLNDNFFTADWNGILNSLPEPILIIGNPPWVTNSALGAFDGNNLPEKNNSTNETGLNALMGKSNFDISEWMILRYVDWLNNRNGLIAVLCKFSVAKKITRNIWAKEMPALITIYKIDAGSHFNVSVDACLLIVDPHSGKGKHKECAIYCSLVEKRPSMFMGFDKDVLLADVNTYRKWSNLRGANMEYKWRSGVKHDCSNIMELIRNDNGTFQNGFGENVVLENDYIYPLLKSSDLNNKRIASPRKHVLITQKRIGEETCPISRKAPLTWNYLCSKKEFLLKRKSSIYKNKPMFSIFGIGVYSFAPWKVAISGLYKNLSFSLVGPLNEKPMMFDDTVYFIPCWTKEEAEFLFEVLNSQPSKEFLESMIFWEDKRPITIDLLKRLDIGKLCHVIDRVNEFLDLSQKRSTSCKLHNGQLSFLANVEHNLST